MPWKRVLDYWPSPLPSLADASIVTVAASSRYDAIATFDQKLSKRSKATPPGRPFRRYLVSRGAELRN